jgi:hypothetical protein
MVAASGLRGSGRRALSFAICSSLTVRQKNTATKHSSSISACLAIDESRRRHEIDLPEAFLKEHQRIIMQNPVLRIPAVPSAFRSRSRNADITIHMRLLPAPIGSKVAVQILIRVLPTVMPNRESKPASGPRIWCWTRCPSQHSLNSVQEMSFGAHPGHYVG